MKRLSERRRCFVEAYLGEAKGNGTRAAILAGCPRGSARVTASRWLTEVDVQEEITRRVAVREQMTDLTNQQIDALLIRMAQSRSESGSTRLGALKELNKCRGRHTVRLEGGETWFDLLAPFEKGG